MNALKHSLSIGLALAALAGGAACGSADGPGGTQEPTVGAAGSDPSSQTESCGIMCEAKGYNCGINKVCYTSLTECASHCREGNFIACTPVLQCPAP